MSPPAPRPSGRLEVVVVTAALLVFGSVSAVVVPPCQTPDEGFSFLRAYHVADGHLWPEMVGEWGGGRFPPAVVRIVHLSTRLIDHPNEKFTGAEWRETAALGWDGEPQPLGLLTAAPYTFVPYLPQAAGVRVGRAAGLGPLGVFYAGRFGNLLFGVALVAAALALAPVSRRFLGLVALMPMTVHLFGSHAPEVGVVGAALLVPAVVLRLALAADRRAAWWELAVVMLAVVWVAACKPPYLPLTAFALAIPAARFGGQLRRAAFVAMLFAVGGAVGLAGIEAARPYYPDPHTIFGFEASVRGQTEFLKHHPERFATAFVEGIVVRGVPMYFRLYKLGWLDTAIDPVAVALYSVVLVLLAAAARADAAAVRVPRWPAALVVLGGLCLTSLSLYLWCTPIGGAVAGLHGRYLLPLVPAGLFLAPGRVPRALGSVRAQRALAAWAVGIMTAVTFAAVASRYYLEAPPLLLRGPVVLAAGVGLAALVHAGRWRPRLPFPAGRSPRGTGSTSAS